MPRSIRGSLFLLALSAALGGMPAAAAREEPGLAEQVAALSERDLDPGESGPFDPDRRIRRLLSSRALLAGNSDPDAETLARAHLELGHRERRESRGERAIAHYRRASQLDPELGAAHLALGTLLGQEQRFRQSARAFAWLAALDPEDPRAYLGRSRALERLGYYHLARRNLEDGAAILPGEPELLHRLARLLAACPDPAVRDGVRARSLAQEALRLGRQAPYAETLAMAMAENGSFSDAAALLEAVLAQARASGADATFVERLGEQLELYRAGHPFRLPEAEP